MGCALLTRHVDTDVSGARGGGFFAGFVTQVANPKALVFFTALLPQFVDAHRPIAGQMLAFGIASTSIELVVLVAYASAAGTARRAIRSTGLVTAIERLGGAVMLGAAAKIAT